MNQLTMPLHEGQRLKERGIQQAIDNEPEQWKQGALAALERYCRHTRTFCAEDFRLAFMIRGGTSPHVPNVWAGLMRAAQSKGWIQATGRFVPAKSPGTHAHRVQEYRSLIYRSAA